MICVSQNTYQGVDLLVDLGDGHVESAQGDTHIAVHGCNTIHHRHVLLCVFSRLAPIKRGAEKLARVRLSVKVVA